MRLAEGQRKVSLLDCALLKGRYLGLLTEIVSAVFGIIVKSLQISAFFNRLSILLIENGNVHSLSKVS